MTRAELRQAAQPVLAVVAEQAKDQRLWLKRPHLMEAHLQLALRRLHDAIADVFGEMEEDRR